MIKFHTEQITLVLATRNRDKAQEIRQKLQTMQLPLVVMSLDELERSGFVLREVEETEPTLEGNACKKARETFRILSEQGAENFIALADDTGLEVAALGGAPGVYSARYAEAELGRRPTYAENVEKLLRQMQTHSNRAARFRTVIALVGIVQASNEQLPLQIEHWVEGMVEGQITHQPHGTNGFGYDPIFEVQSLGKTFAELSLEEKNRISHRALALEKACLYLQNLFAGNSNAILRNSFNKATEI
ncbi:MAG: RdgB/HAM1 family non-canonical purine NTP pyrophosphatase [Chloroherpetonaceae bacterium]|nr:RdgB/HAM1 family non-canonical purine NTP pyrophosphatase [Chloroherpetonaceae bacterium]MDW8018940.1 RdgB/HAM1 family non-canonical purine NTP pyrophosphatase [Chloroherpetonaceae bacterium]